MRPSSRTGHGVTRWGMHDAVRLVRHRRGATRADARGLSVGALSPATRAVPRERRDQLEQDRVDRDHRARARPERASRHTSRVLSLAMVQGAVYDAVNAIDGGYQPYLVAPARPIRRTRRRRPSQPRRFRVLVGLLPRRQGSSILQPPTTASLSAIADGARRRAGSRSARRRPRRCSGAGNDGRSGRSRRRRHRPGRVAARAAAGSDRRVARDPARGSAT